jgi:hypothetical protein
VTPSSWQDTVAPCFSTFRDRASLARALRGPALATSSVSTKHNNAARLSFSPNYRLRIFCFRRPRSAVQSRIIRGTVLWITTLYLPPFICSEHPWVWSLAKVDSHLSLKCQLCVSTVRSVSLVCANGSI